MIDVTKKIAGVSYNGTPIQLAGAPLPSSINKIDGGSFTPSTDTLTGNYSITHNLGEVPKGFIVWAPTLTEEAYSIRYVNVMCVSNAFGTLRQVNTTGLPRNLDFVPAAGDITAATIKATVASNYYKAGLIYNWLVWA